MEVTRASVGIRGEALTARFADTRASIRSPLHVTFRVPSVVVLITSVETVVAVGRALFVGTENDTFSQLFVGISADSNRERTDIRWRIGRGRDIAATSRVFGWTVGDDSDEVVIPIGSGQTNF